MKRELVYALLLPFVALALQWMFWQMLSPFVWFLFFPAVFFSARLAGFAGGLAGTLISTILVWYFFMEPQFGGVPVKPTQLYSVALFLVMGYLLSHNERRLQRADRKAVQALASKMTTEQEIQQIQHKAAELEKAQQDLQDYQRIVSCTADMLGMVDRDLRYAVTNPAYAAMMNLSPQELQGRKVEDVLGTDNFSHIKPMLDKALAGEDQQFIAEPELSDGRRRVLDVRYQSYVRNGTVQGIVVTLCDITELRDSAAAQHDSEERLRLALDASNDGFWDWDLPNGTIYRSPRCYQLMGHLAAEDTNNYEFFERITHPDDLVMVRQAIQAHQQGKTAKLEFEFRVITHSGEIRWIRVRGGTVARDANGTPRRMLGILSDVSASVIAQEVLYRQTAELEQRNAELERFNRATVGRELDMVALKQQINTLSLQLEQPAPYALDFLADGTKPEPSALP